MSDTIRRPRTPQAERPLPAPHPSDLPLIRRAIHAQNVIPLCKGCRGLGHTLHMCGIEATCECPYHGALRQYEQDLPDRSC